jgi:hypothetical protein
LGAVSDSGQDGWEPQIEPDFRAQVRRVLRIAALEDFLVRGDPDV